MRFSGIRKSGGDDGFENFVGVLVQSMDSILVKPKYLFSCIVVPGCASPKWLMAK